MHDPWLILAALHAHGDPARAAAAAGVDVATLYRRVGRLEHEIGGPMFLRGRGGWEATAAGERLLAAGVQLQTTLADARALARAEHEAVAGELRVALSDTLARGFVAPALGRFRARYPDLRVEIAVSNALSDLAEREADCALRAESGPAPTLAGQQVGTLHHGVYAARELWPARAPATSLAALRGLPWLGYGGVTQAFTAARWMARRKLDALAVAGFDDVAAMATAAAGGAGVAVLPVHVARDHDALRLVWRPPQGLAADVWLLAHPRLRRTGRVAAFFGFFAEEWRRERHRFLLPG